MTSTLQLKMFMHALETPPPSSQHFDSIDLGIFGVDDEPLAFNSWEIAPSEGRITGYLKSGFRVLEVLWRNGFKGN